MQTQPIQGYWTTEDLSKRYQWSRSTILRKSKKDKNPLPSPRFQGSGSHNRWAIDDVVAWEEREKELTQHVA